MSRNTPKRNLSSSSSSSPTKPSGNQTKVFVTPNRYASLSEDNAFDQEVFSNPSIFSAPSISTPSKGQCNTPTSHVEIIPSKNFYFAPPFYLSGGYEFNTLKKSLLDLVIPSGINFKNTPNHLIIRTDGVTNYNSVYNYLIANEQIKFHTYLPNSSKPYAVFIRHLHPSTAVEDIQACLIGMGHEVIRVSNILHQTTKRPLPLFRIDLKVAENNSDILKLDLLLHTRIKIELPKKKLSPPQCHDCQAYYHTSNFCHQSPRCVKCGDNHYTSVCTKAPSEPAKCAPCSGPHTASYKGCPVFKKLSENRKKSKSHKPYRHPAPNDTTPSLKKFTSSSNQKQNRSYANVTANHTGNTSPSTATPESLISKFLEDFKAIINPLLLLLTTVVNHLLPSSFPIPPP